MQKWFDNLTSTQIIFLRISAVPCIFLGLTVVVPLLLIYLGLGSKITLQDRREREREK